MIPCHPAALTTRFAEPFHSYLKGMKGFTEILRRTF